MTTVDLLDGDPERAEPGARVRAAYTVHEVGAGRRTLSWTSPGGWRSSAEVPLTVCELAIVSAVYTLTDGTVTCLRCRRGAAT